MAVGEFSGDDTEGECVPQAGATGEGWMEDTQDLGSQEPRPHSGLMPLSPHLTHNFLFSLQTLLLACPKGTSPMVM